MHVQDDARSLIVFTRGTSLFLLNFSLDQPAKLREGDVPLRWSEAGEVRVLLGTEEREARGREVRGLNSVSALLPFEQLPWAEELMDGASCR